MTLPAGKKIYFASDFHLGTPNKTSSLEREKRVIRWLESIEHDAEEIFLVGDIFDFWFEYKHAIPKGFVRLQGKIAQLTDRGIPVHFFTGNHDMWMFDYFPSELGIQLYRKPIERVWNGTSFFIGHGDGLGPGDRGYKFLKKVFAARWSQWCFARLHPNFGIGLANYFSRKSRAATGDADSKFLGEENEWLVSFCKEELQKKHNDFFIFGHRHLPMDIQLTENARYINLGEWLNYCTYGVFDGENMVLERFEG
jgi:UDP-2,3-diacylglucosamine hydrolase